mmetsp:Transcript_16152/g.50782  ORF Transcript_16152/g.50782 Transcript_16152/m.50782 type:complete len:374 (-) Transcript_16152:1046-2167(-)
MDSSACRSSTTFLSTTTPPAPAPGDSREATPGVDTAAPAAAAAAAPSFPGEPQSARYISRWRTMASTMPCWRSRCSLRMASSFLVASERLASSSSYLALTSAASRSLSSLSFRVTARSSWFLFCSSSMSRNSTSFSVITAPALPGGCCCPSRPAACPEPKRPARRSWVSLSSTCTWCPRSAACPSSDLSSRWARPHSASLPASWDSSRRRSSAASSRRAVSVACDSRACLYSARCSAMRGALRSNSAMIWLRTVSTRFLSARSRRQASAASAYLLYMSVMDMPSRIAEAAAAAGDISARPRSEGAGGLTKPEEPAAGALTGVTSPPPSGDAPCGGGGVPAAAAFRVRSSDSRFSLASLSAASRAASAAPIASR